MVEPAHDAMGAGGPAHAVVRGRHPEHRRHTDRVDHEGSAGATVGRVPDEQGTRREGDHEGPHVPRAPVAGLWRSRHHRCHGHQGTGRDPPCPAALPFATMSAATFSARQRLTLLATSVGLFMIFLDATIVNVALPDIQEDFDAGEQGLQWVVAAYSLTMGMFIMSAATLADQRGRRRVYIAGMALFAGASALCGLAPTLLVLNIGRGSPGRRRGDGERGLARARERGLPRSEGQGEGDRHLDGHRVGGPGDRSDRRRLPHRDARLAEHLLRQRRHRRGGHPLGARLRRGVARPHASRPRPPGAGPVHRRRRRRSRTR